MSRIYLSPPHMSGDERALLLDAFDSNWIAPLGPHVEAFEQEFAAYVGMPHAVALSSGTAALHLALRLLDVGPGDEVVVSSFTFAATVYAIRYVGAEPVFVDSDRDTWNMSPALLEEALADAAARGRRPKAVLVVDVLGQCADYDAISRIAAAHGVPIVEDAAEALGATYRGRPAGAFGVIGCFSFNGNKMISTSGGGMLVTHDEAWAKRARYLASQARQPVAHYEHIEVGYNYRLSNLLAAVGRGQLRSLDARVDIRREHFRRYAAQLAPLPGVTFMPEPATCRSARWLTSLTIDAELFGASREDIRLALDAQNIEARPLWKPMHLQPAFADCRTVGGDFTAHLFANGLSLPSGSNLSSTDHDRVVATVRSLASTPALNR